MMDDMEKKMRIDMLKELLNALKGKSLEGFKPKEDSAEVTVVKSKGDPEELVKKLLEVEGEDETEVESPEEDVTEVMEPEIEEETKGPMSKDEWLKKLKWENNSNDKFYYFRSYCFNKT